MRHRILERAAAAGVALSLVVAAAAFADSVRGDSDTVTADIQGSRDLGAVAPDAVVDVPIAFELVCANLQHSDTGQSVVVAIDELTVSAGHRRHGPGDARPGAVDLGEGWRGLCRHRDTDQRPRDGDGHRSAGSRLVRVHPALLAHAVARRLERRDAFSGSTVATFTLTVVVPPNTPPVLFLPAAMTVEADGPAGWTATYTVSATDAEDDPDPTPTCAPAVGTVIPLGTTTVACSVTDSGGLVTTGSFVVMVSAPQLPPPPPAPEPVVTLTATFGPPVQEDGLVGRAGRTIPLKVDLLAGDDPVGEGNLGLAVTPCAGGEVAVELGDGVARRQ